MADAPARHVVPPERFDPAKASLSRSWLVTVLHFLRPHHVLRPRDRCRTITPLLLVGVLPEPVHAGRSDAEISPITQFARVPGKKLPQEAPSCPVPVCPAPALADLHHAHPHPSFARGQHSAHVENPPAPHDASVLQMGKIGQFCGESLTADHPSALVDSCATAKSPPNCPRFFFAQDLRLVTHLTRPAPPARSVCLIFRNGSRILHACPRSGGVTALITDGCAREPR